MTESTNLQPLPTPDLNRDEHWYALIDSALVPDIARRIYELDETPEADTTYRGTELDKLKDVSPWLVRVKPNSPLLDWLLTSVLPARQGILYTSAFGLEENRSHWGWLRHIRHPLGGLNVARLHDSRILGALLNIANDPEISELLGTVSMLWLPDDDKSEWRQYQDLQPAFQGKTDFYHLSESQLDAMAQVSGQEKVEKLARHIQNFFPDYAGQNAEGLARQHINEAQKLGFHTPQECFYYSNVICLLNQRQVRHPHIIEIQKLLTEPSQQSPAQRVKRAAELAAMNQDNNQHDHL